MIAQEAALKDAAESKLRRRMASTKTLNCADVKIGDLVLFYDAPDQKSQPKWRDPECYLAIADAGATARYRRQTFEVVRCCAHTRQDREEIGDMDRPPGPGIKRVPHYGKGFLRTTGKAFFE